MGLNQPIFFQLMNWWCFNSQWQALYDLDLRTNSNATIPLGCDRMKFNKRGISWSKRFWRPIFFWWPRCRFGEIWDQLKLKITNIEPIIVSVPYKHRETSTRVQRDGVTAVLVKITTDAGIVGWGESCPGPNVESIYQIIVSTIPVFTGRNPVDREAIAQDFFSTAHWFHREMSGNFAFAGIDMALWDIFGKACGQPV